MSPCVKCQKERAFLLSHCKTCAREIFSELQLDCEELEETDDGEVLPSEAGP